MIEFWGFPISFNSRKVHWMLEELEVPYKFHLVNLVAGEHRQPAFHAVNPLGRVPVLAEDDVHLGESNAIVAYLAARHGAGRFHPEAAAEQAQIQQWLHTQSAHVGPALQKPWRLRWISPLIGEPHDPAAYPGLVAEARPWLAALDAHLTGREWFVGKSLSAADVVMGATLALAPQVDLDLAEYPALAAWFARVASRPAFGKTAPPPLA
jgi:glutathione S-transferase